MKDIIVVNITGLGVFPRMVSGAARLPTSLRKAMEETVLWANQDIQKQHYPGHGYVTGTLRRSYHTRVTSYRHGSAQTTPASMSAAASGPRLGQKIFYAPSVERLYGMVASTKARLPKVAVGIYQRHLGRLARRITGG